MAHVHVAVVQAYYDRQEGEDAGHSHVYPQAIALALLLTVEGTVPRNHLRHKLYNGLRIYWSFVGQHLFTLGFFVVQVASFGFGYNVFGAWQFGERHLLVF